MEVQDIQQYGMRSKPFSFKNMKIPDTLFSALMLAPSGAGVVGELAPTGNPGSIEVERDGQVGIFLPNRSLVRMYLSGLTGSTPMKVRIGAVLGRYTTKAG